MKRWLITLLLLVLVAAAAIPAASLATWPGCATDPGGNPSLSKTGAMRISEESMIDAEVMALTEINQKRRPSGTSGGVGDRRRSFRLAYVCPGSAAINRGRESQRDLRLLDLGKPQERQAGG